MTEVQVMLNVLNIVFSIVAISFWVKVARISPLFRTPAWWPIALLANNLLYSIALIIDLVILDILPSEFLTYWSQAIRLQLAITLVYGVIVMRQVAKRTNGK